MRRNCYTIKKEKSTKLCSTKRKKNKLNDINNQQLMKIKPDSINYNQDDSKLIKEVIKLITVVLDVEKSISDKTMSDIKWTSFKRNFVIHRFEIDGVEYGLYLTI